MSVPTHATKPQLDHEVVKQALKEFYMIHNASRISSIDTIVDSYVGKEVDLLEELKKRYKVEFEPFNVILSQFRLNQSNGSETETSSVLATEDHTAGTTTTQQQQKDEISTPPQTAATRSSLSALGFPTLFTDKLMNGVNWKGFTIESSTVPADTKKENEIPEIEEKFIDFAALARETKHPEELLIQIQKSLENFSTLEKNVKLSLRKLETVNIPVGNNSSRKSDAIISYLDLDGESSKDLDGRSQDSLRLEIISLRELVDNMRNYIFDSMQKHTFQEESLNSGSNANVDKETIETETVDREGDNDNVVDSSTEKDNCDIDKGLVINTAHIDKLAELKTALSVNWKEQDELRLRINELSLENEALRESIRSKDSLIRDRDVVSLQLQREIKDLKEQLRQSNENKNELLQLNESKISLMEKQFKEQVNLMRERFCLEQEDALAHVASVAEVQQSWQATLSQEAQTEIIRLRVELANSRRQESQREREVAYLQRQLTEAAKQLAQYVVESEDEDGGNE